MNGELTYGHPHANGMWKSVLTHVIVIVITWAFSAGIEYGYMSTKMADLEYRVTRLEGQNYIPGQYGVTKPEFDQFQEDVDRRLERIERKQDALGSRDR